MSAFYRAPLPLGVSGSLWASPHSIHALLRFQPLSLLSPKHTLCPVPRQNDTTCLLFVRSPGPCCPVLLISHTAPETSLCAPKSYCSLLHLGLHLHHWQAPACSCSACSQETEVLVVAPVHRPFRRSMSQEEPMLPGFLVRALPTVRTSCNVPKAFSPLPLPTTACFCLPLFQTSFVLGTTVFPTLTPSILPSTGHSGRPALPYVPTQHVSVFRHNFHLAAFAQELLKLPVQRACVLRARTV